jgi:hypothetical protein
MFARMGDRLAVAFSMLLEAEVPTDEPTGVKIELGLRHAFEDPAKIENEADREPRMAMMLLRQLWERSRSEPRKRSLEDAMAEISGCSLQ